MFDPAAESFPQQIVFENLIDRNFGVGVRVGSKRRKKVREDDK